MLELDKGERLTEGPVICQYICDVARRTAADAYLFNVTRWARLVKLDLNDLKNVTAYVERVLARPAVLAAYKAEGLRT